MQMPVVIVYVPEIVTVLLRHERRLAVGEALERLPLMLGDRTEGRQIPVQIDGLAEIERSVADGLRHAIYSRLQPFYGRFAVVDHRVQDAVEQPVGRPQQRTRVLGHHPTGVEDALDLTRVVRHQKVGTDEDVQLLIHQSILSIRGSRVEDRVGIPVILVFLR